MRKEEEHLIWGFVGALFVLIMFSLITKDLLFSMNYSFIAFLGVYGGVNLVYDLMHWKVKK